MRVIVSKVVTLTATGVNLLYTQQERVIMSRTIEVIIKDDFDPTLGADIVEAVEDFEQLLQVEFEKGGIN